MTRLVLSLFPGIGLLDAQFEALGFCVVRGPDLLWGGDVATFSPPAAVFAGVIGGPPCQDFSSARRTPPTGEGVRCLEQFCRIVAEARPQWWIAENVPQVPDLSVEGYAVQRIDVQQAWWSNVRRSRVIQFGRHTAILERSQPLDIPRGCVSPDAEPAALASDERTFEELCRLQGLSPDFALPGFSDEGRKRAVGNGVPALMGRIIARAVLAAVYGETKPGTASPDPTFDAPKRCEICQRRVSGRRLTCSDACRYHKSRRSRAAHSRVAGPTQIARRDEPGRVSRASLSMASQAAQLPRVSLADPDEPAGDLASPDGAGLRDFLAAGQYPGGKNLDGVWQWITGHFPPHAMYIEPFVGSGGIVRRKVPALRTLLLDADPVVADWWRSNIDDLAPGARFEAQDGLKWCEEWLDRLSPNVLVYLDPPYLLGRVSDQPYNQKFTDEQHARLLDAVNRATCLICLSGYASELYNRRLPRRKWRVSTRKVPTRWGGPKVEYLWHNFDPQSAIGWQWQNPGVDFRDRERIKRKAARWTANVASMPPDERAAVLGMALAQIGVESFNE